MRQFIGFTTVVCGSVGGMFCYLLFAWLHANFPAWYPQDSLTQMIFVGMLSAGLAAWWKDVNY